MVAGAEDGVTRERRQVKRINKDRRNEREKGEVVLSITSNCFARRITKKVLSSPVNLLQHKSY